MANTTRVTMPQLGESVHEGTIAKWLVKPGDKVVEFEPMLEVDTDKVNAEVPAPVTGVLREILAKEGDTVQAGSEIAVVELEGGPAQPSEQGAAPATTEVRIEDVDTGEDAGGAPEAMPSEAQAKQEDEQPPSAPAPAQRPQPPSQAAAPAQAAPKPEPTGEHRFSPGVMLAAQELGVDLNQVRGTGLGGRVTKKDVREFATARERGQEGSQAVQAAAQPAPPPVEAAEGDQVVPLTRIRRLIAENMTRSKTTIPHAWQTQEVDMSGVVANRGANKSAFQQREGFSLTYLPYVVAAAIQGLREHPEVNATFNGDSIVVHRDLNVGISVGLEDTLVVPVLKRADSLSLAGLARAINDVATRARNKKLQADDLAGGTFTVNNSGTFGTLFSYSVINPGQAGILTMEAIVERPVAVGGMIGIKPMMYLCFSFDHRVLDGLQAARFLVSCRKWLESVTAETPIY